MSNRFCRLRKMDENSLKLRLKFRKIILETGVPIVVSDKTLNCCDKFGLFFFFAESFLQEVKNMLVVDGGRFVCNQEIKILKIEGDLLVEKFPQGIKFLLNYDNFVEY